MNNQKRVAMANILRKVADRIRRARSAPDRATPTECGVRYVVETCYENGHSEQAADHFTDMAAAGRFAIDLADQLGGAPADALQGAPQRVVIYQGNRLKLSIAVISGESEGCCQ